MCHRGEQTEGDSNCYTAINTARWGALLFEDRKQERDEGRGDTIPWVSWQSLSKIVSTRVQVPTKIC